MTSLQTSLAGYVEARLDEKHIQSELSSVLAIRCKLSSDVKMSSGINSKLLENKKRKQQHETTPANTPLHHRKGLPSLKHTTLV